MRSTRVVGAAILAVSGLVLTGFTGVSASATQKTEITDVNPSHPIKGETFHLKGTITTHITRGVDLERRFHDTWKLVTSSSTNDAGEFDITTSTTSKRTYRVVAHSLTLGQEYKRRVTPSVTVTPVSQTAKVTVSDTTPAVGHKLTIKGTFTPVRHHRSGIILISHTKHASDAFDGAPGTENSLGKFVVSFTPSSGDRGKTYYFFAFVEPSNGAPSKTSAPVKVVVH